LSRSVPFNIEVEWFNNVSGLDDYKDARLLIAIGRTQPGPSDIEGIAGALTGLEPFKASLKANGSAWFDKIVRGIRLKDGTGHPVDCDLHPDPMVEAIRSQICEAELIQAIGRGRGVNRTPDTPLDIDILANVCLPVTVDTVAPWERVSPDAGRARGSRAASARSPGSS